MFDISLKALNFSRMTRRLAADDHFVGELPGLDSSTKITQYAGYLPVDVDSTGFLFYWLFEASKNPQDGAKAFDSEVYHSSPNM